MAETRPKLCLEVAEGLGFRLIAHVLLRRLIPEYVMPGCGFLASKP